MIDYYNHGKKRPTYEEIQGRIVLVSDLSTWGGVKWPVVVTQDDGRSVIGHEVESDYNDDLKRHVYSQNGEQRKERTRIDKSGIRVACDTVAEAEANMEVSRVYERTCNDALKAARSRIAAMEGVSIISSGPVVMVEMPEGPKFLDKRNGETIHSIKEDRA